MDAMPRPFLVLSIAPLSSPGPRRGRLAAEPPGELDGALEANGAVYLLCLERGEAGEVVVVEGDAALDDVADGLGGAVRSGVLERSEAEDGE